MTTQDATPAATPMPFQGETYVGEPSDPTAFVGVAVGKAAGQEARPTRAYLCARTERSRWFVGERVDDRLELALQAKPGDGMPVAPAQLIATLGPDGVTGEALLPDVALTFAAVPATGIAGLSTVTRDRPAWDNRVRMTNGIHPRPTDSCAPMDRGGSCSCILLCHRG